MIVRLPIDLILEIVQHCTFSDLWRCAQTCRQFREVVSVVAIYLYRVDLDYECQNDKFTCFVRGAMVYLDSQFMSATNGADTSSVDYSDPTIERVARRVCQEIYDITPEADWEAEFERLMEATMLTAFQHVMFHHSSHSVSHYAYFCGTLQQEAITFFEVGYKDTARDACLDLLRRHLSTDPYAQPLSNLTQPHRKRTLAQFRTIVAYLCALGTAGVVNASDLQHLTSLHLLRVLGTTETIEIAETRLNTIMDLLQVVIKSRYFSWQNGRELSFFSSLLSEAADTHAQLNKQLQVCCVCAGLMECK
ncbi:hypothetical protein BC937DRAFT_92343 [Endogone sp. FLAS-F59071]|nr:hypothetical protein BC937DRAFT_92343 [Endogone sp. FLAS-F59071]|eukprot:RUS15534.1 hypothetical protein BC937DRAFT_92343 [Endogone sp. FLAS-F59071]